MKTSNTFSFKGIHHPSHTALSFRVTRKQPSPYTSTTRTSALPIPGTHHLGEEKMFRSVLLFFCLMLPPLVAWADNSTVLETIVVIGEKLIVPTKQTNELVHTGSEITRGGLEQAGGKADTSVYEAMDILPGISVESADPFGLAAEQRSIRVRGVRGMMTAMTVVGVPNYGGNPMGPRDYLYDMENFDSIAVYKGAIPADLGTGVGARAGAVELRPKWPGELFGLNLNLSVGSNDYRRAYMRMDSGNLTSSGTAVSLSASHTQGEKWKGPGNLGPRVNANFMIEQPYHGEDAIQVWVNHNNLEQDLYKALTYAETRDLEESYRNDYSPDKTGIKAHDINYYKYNRGEYVNTDLLAVIPWTFNDMFRLTFKPYYSLEDAKIYGGSTSQGGIIQRRKREIERYGMNSQLDVTWNDFKASLGYLVESTDMSITTRNYDPRNMAFRGHGIYTENDGNGLVQTPYLTIAGRLGQFDWQGGLKYFRYDEPASTGYLSPAPSYDLVKVDDLGRDSRTYDALLPSIGVSYTINDTVQVYASYGRTHIRPYSYVPLINLYNQNRSRFQGAGVTLADMFAGYDMEITDNYELGLRLQTDWCEITPAVFFSTHQDLLTTVYDPRVNLSYAQNIGEATGYGMEIESNFFLSENLTAFLNPTYTRLTYDNDLTYQGLTRDTKGKQVVDTPEWMCKAGLVYRLGNFEFTPTARYVGARYGDAQHDEKVTDYVTADFGASYVTTDLDFAKSLKIALNLYNLFNTKYVSKINASDDSRSGSTSYNVGAPFSAMLSLNFEF